MPRAAAAACPAVPCRALRRPAPLAACPAPPCVTARALQFRDTPLHHASSHATNQKRSAGGSGSSNDSVEAIADRRGPGQAWARSALEPEAGPGPAVRARPSPAVAATSPPLTPQPEAGTDSLQPGPLRRGTARRGCRDIRSLAWTPGLAPAPGGGGALPPALVTSTGPSPPDSTD